MTPHQHIFTPSDKKDYEVCQECGSYHSIAQESPESIYGGDYWNPENGRSTLEEQIGNLIETETCGISKVDKILQFVPECKTVLEIACAPGVLLNKLSELGYEAWGVEPNEGYIGFITDQAKKANVVLGYFPQCFKNSVSEIFDCIIGMDIFEHIDDYDTFIKSVRRLLTPGGTAIFMSPIILEDGLYRERDFKPDEHCWIFTKKFLDPYLKGLFSSVLWDRWQDGHELFIVTK